jgi:hypothetical protein
MKAFNNVLEGGCHEKTSPMHWNHAGDDWDHFPAIGKSPPHQCAE